MHHWIPNNIRENMFKGYSMFQNVWRAYILNSRSIQWRMREEGIFWYRRDMSAPFTIRVHQMLACTINVLRNEVSVLAKIFLFGGPSGHVHHLIYYGPFVKHFALALFRFDVPWEIHFGLSCIYFLSSLNGNSARWISKSGPPGNTFRSVWHRLCVRSLWISATACQIT